MNEKYPYPDKRKITNGTLSMNKTNTEQHLLLVFSYFFAVIRFPDGAE